MHRASLYELLERFCHINTNYKNLKAGSFLAKNHGNAIRKRIVGRYTSPSLQVAYVKMRRDHINLQV